MQSQGRWLFPLVCLLSVSACKNQGSEELAEVDDSLSTRPVATVYKTSAELKCHSDADQHSSVVVNLPNGQLLDLVSAQERAVKGKNNYWLHVYPRLSHRPSCYAAASFLIPVH